MRQSRLLIPTLKEAPPEARGAARALLWRGGFLRRATGGGEALLPLGARVRALVVAMARRELERAGASEARGDAAALGELLRREVRSPKQLPLALFSVGDELVVAAAGAPPIADAITRVVARAGVTAQAIAAGEGSALVVADADGDDTWLACVCGFATVEEGAPLRAAAERATASEPLTEVHTPGAKSIGEVVAFFSASGGATIGVAQFVKTLIYVDDGNQPLLALVRGDRAVDERKLGALAGVARVRLAADAVVREVTGAEVGFAGAQGRRVAVFADGEVAQLASAVTGANRTDHHVRGFNLAREVPDARIGDLRRAVAGDACARCDGGRYQGARGAVLAELAADGARLSIDALIAAAVAQHHDGDGIVWPAALAPFDVCVVAVGNEPEIGDAAAALEEALGARGLDVLYDDRDERAGAKFKDADLVGIPVRVTVGKRGLAEGAFECKQRGQKETTMIPKDRIVDEIVARVRP
jgi:prolyl-tRNA synthetase